MNDKTKELAEQAKTWCRDNLVLPTPAEWNDKLFEKFAELVVKECTDIMTDTGDSEWDSIGRASAHAIEDHFGVK